MGKTIIITGASRGIGLAISKYLLAAPRSCNLVVVARTLGPLQKLKDEHGSQVEVVGGDVADFSIAHKAVAAALAAYGRLDGLVLNHGVLAPVSRLESSSVEEWKKAFDVNFFSLLEFVKQAIPHLRLSRGKVIFTSTGAMNTPVNGWAMYATSKGALNHLNTALGHEEPEITSLAIRPGLVDTEMQEELRAKHIPLVGPKDGERFITAHRDGKLLKPEQPGHVMAKLVLEAPSELSGKYLSWNAPELEAFQEDI